ncbi:MAG: glycosyltransferase family 2 protein [Pirellulaceae bacterium]|nr:glycosyltransferase family 2 protein [Pirellulaceae bacterium]
MGKPRVCRPELPVASDGQGNSIPRVSIGLPLYNGQRYLEAALDSLLAQTLADFELIVSDNHSTDGSQRICERYAARDPRIRYERQPRNRGAVWNFNRVCELARGQYFKWAAHDDICRPTFLERCVSALEQHPEAVLSFPRTQRIDERGWPCPDSRQHYAEEGAVDDPRPCRRLCELLINRVWVHEVYGVIRTSALRRTRLLPRYVGAEKVLMAELALQGTFHQVAEPLFGCRWHAEQASWISTAQDEQRWRDPQAVWLARLPRHAACAWGQAGAVVRARLPVGERLRCGGAVLQWILQTRKWPRVLADYCRGTGSGGGLRR